MTKAVGLETLAAIAEAHFGERGRWAYEAVCWANQALFGGELPPTLVQWALTPYGACLGQTHHGYAPVITLHPSIWGEGTVHARGLIEAWDGAPACKLYTLDVIIHELMHVKLGKRAPTTVGKSSHDNPAWAAEVERLSPLLGLGRVVAAHTKRKRSEGRMLRVPAKEGALPLRALATWPRRPPEHYTDTGALPW
jgi:hypothetical protein